MKELLTEFFASLLGEAKEVRKPDTAKVSKGGKWYTADPESGGVYVGRVDRQTGKWIDATEEEKQADKERRASQKPAAKKGAAKKAPTRKQPVKQEPDAELTPRQQDIKAKLEEPDEDTNPAAVYNPEDVMQRAVVEARDDKQTYRALEVLASDEESRALNGEWVIDKKTKKRVKKPKVGMGGLAASTGETLCTQVQTEMANGRYSSDKARRTKPYKARQKKLQGEFERITELCEQGSKKACKAKESKERYYADLATMHGFFDADGAPDIGAAIDIEAEAQVWVEQRDKELAGTLAGKKFTSREARTSWLTAAFHSGHALLNNAPDNWDRTQPSRVLKANARTDGAVQTLLERKRDAAPKGSKERAHYENQLEVWAKFQSYHDTYMVYTDKDGRINVLNISNKKSSDLIDPHHNTTPIKRVRLFMEAARDAGLVTTGRGGDIAGPIARSEKRTRQMINENNSIVMDEQSGFGAIRPSSAGVMAQMMRYLPGAHNKATDGYYTKLIENKQFRAYLDRKGIKPNQIEKVMGALISYAKELRNSGAKVPEAVFYIAIKIGQMAQNFYKRQASGQSSEQIAETFGVDVELVDAVLGNADMEKMAEMKATHAAGLQGAYKLFTTDLYKLDGRSPDDDGDNGPHVETFIRGALSALHIDTYITNYDDNILIQSGAESTKPIDVRNCMAKLSGFKGDATTPEGRKKLLKHLGKKIKVEPGSDRMYLVSKEKDEEGNPKKVYIAEEMWRGSGAKSQKVTAGFGDDLRTCLKQEAGQRRLAKRSGKRK